MPRSAASHIEEAKKRFRTTLQPESVEAVAVETGFVRRQRIITGTSVFWALILTMGAQCTQYISDALRTINAREGWSICYKPFWNRLGASGLPSVHERNVCALVS